MSDYWAKRREKLLSQMESDEKKLNAKLADVYASERAKLEREIAAYYAQYGENNVLRYRNLLGTLGESNRKLLIERMDDFAAKYPLYANLIPVRASIYKLNELEGIQASILMQQLEIGAVEQSEVDAHLKKQAVKSANLAAEEMGFGSSFYDVNSQVVKATVGASWAEEGGFSEAIWGNRQKLAAYLNDDFAKLAARGVTYEQCAKELGDRFENVSAKNAKRLVFTEGTFVLNEAQAQVHEQQFEHYAVSCADGRACAVCRQIQASQTVQPEEFRNRKPGVNFPPLHPWCRCSYTVEVADWDAWVDGQVAKGEAKIAESNKVIKLAERRLDKYAKQMADYEYKRYERIWKDAVTVKDYQEKRKSIQKKRDWYNEQLAGLSPNSVDYKVFSSRLELLDEFEKDGKMYVWLQKSTIKARKEIVDAKAAIAKLKGEAQEAPDDRFSEERKRTAKRFKRRLDADKYFRPLLDEAWNKLTDYQKFALWKYTENSNPMNKALSGYEETWNRSSFKGVGKADWGHEDSYRHLPSAFKKFRKEGTADNVDHAKTIAELTKAIDKYELKDDCWFKRKSDVNGLAGLLEGDVLSFDEAKKLVSSFDTTAMAGRVENGQFTNHSFYSTAIADNGTFGSGAEVTYRIYAPKGTHCIYAEPQSHYGNTIKKPELYEPGMSYSSVGGEAEMLFQRGTVFRITKIYSKGHGIEVEMEVVSQPDFFKTGSERTE